MAKKIQIEFDIDNKDLKIAGEDTLSLTQQLRILKKELQNPNLGQAEFEILRGKIGDVEDSIAKTTVKSRDFFGVLSTLPGPIGGIASSLSGAIDTLKVFSSFSLKDIKNSFNDVLDDVKNIVKGFLGLTDATKKQAAADKELATASETATTATQTQNAATKTLTVSERAATIATNALKLALASLGIGLVIIAVTKLVEIVGELITGTKAAEQANKDFEESFKSLTSAIEENKKATKDNSDLAILQAKIQGKSEKELFKIKQDNLNKEIIDNAEAKKKLQAQNEKLLLDTRLSEDERENKIKEVNAEIAKNSQDLNDLLVAQRRLPLEEELRVAEERRQKEKENANKRLQLLQQQNAQIEQDTKAANERLLKLQQEYDVLTATNDDTANKIRLKQAFDQEIKEINALKLKNQKINGIVVTGEQTRQRLLEQAQKNFEIKQEQLNKEQNRKAIKNIIDFLDLAEQIRSDANDSEFEKRRVKTNLNAQKEKEDLKDTTRDLIKEQEALLEQFPQNAARIQEDIKNILATSADAQKDIETKRVKELAEIDKNEQDDKIQKLEETNAKLNEKQQKQLDNELRILELRNQVLGEGTAEYFRNREEILRKAYLKEQLLEINNYDLLIAKAAGNAEEQKRLEQQKTDALLAIKEKYVKDSENLFNQEVEAYGRLVSQTLDSIGGLTSAIAASYDEEAKSSEAAFEKRKKLQIATATMSAASGIVQILTQPSTLPSPVDFIVKGINAAALAISTAVQIGNIKKTTFNAEGGGQQSNRMGRGYAEGGLIGGKRHSQGGTMIEAERGEAIMTRGAVTMFAPMLSMMNQMGGGVSFSSNLSTARPDMPLVSNPSQEQQPLIVKTYVVENEMTSTQQKQARLKDLSTL
jgi:hypothetical protein